MAAARSSSLGVDGGHGNESSVVFVEGCVVFVDFVGVGDNWLEDGLGAVDEADALLEGLDLGLCIGDEVSERCLALVGVGGQGRVGAEGLGCDEGLVMSARKQGLDVVVEGALEEGALVLGHGVEEALACEGGAVRSVEGGGEVGGGSVVSVAVEENR